MRTGSFPAQSSSNPAWPAGMGGYQIQHGVYTLVECTPCWIDKPSMYWFEERHQ